MMVLIGAFSDIYIQNLILERKYFKNKVLN